MEKKKWGGKRPGSGNKPGINLKPDILKRVRHQISIPRWLVDRLKKEETNLSGYILSLILQDKGWKAPK